jgi:hypothetical protein
MFFSSPFIFAGRMSEGANSLEFKVNRFVYSPYTAAWHLFAKCFKGRVVNQHAANCVALAYVSNIYGRKTTKKVGRVAQSV